MIITLKSKDRQSIDIEMCLKSVPNHLFKCITFDCGKEFSNWKSISNSNGLLRKDGLYKRMNFNEVDEIFIQAISSKRNNIPRKSLHYKIPLEVFLSYIEHDVLSSLI